MKTFSLITVLALFLFGLFVGKALSQTPGDIFIEQAAFSHNDAVSQFTNDFSNLMQRSTELINGSEDIDQQVVLNLFGARNIATIEQDGFLNNALLNLIGVDNKASLVQEGNGNLATINLIGSGNQLNYIQLGDENHLHVNFIGSALNQQFQQMGNYQNMQISGIGIPIQVSQTGNGASIIIDTY